MKSNDRPTDVARITLTSKDGAKQEIDIDDDVHYILAFVKVSLKGGIEVPLETFIKGSTNVCGEILYQILEAHRPFIEHCRKRAIEKGLKQLKAKGIDPDAEAFKNTPVVGGVQ